MSSAYSNMTQQEMASWQAESMMRERLDESMGNYMPRQRQAPLKKGRNSSYKKTRTSSNLFERLKSKLLSGSNTRTSKRPSKRPSKKTSSIRSSRIPTRHRLPKRRSHSRRLAPIRETRR